MLKRSFVQSIEVRITFLTYQVDTLGIEFSNSLKSTFRKFMQKIILIICLIFSLEAAAQSPNPEEARFLTEYAQYSLRTELSASKVNAVTNGYQRGNRDASLSTTREIANLREELAGMLSQAARYNLAIQKAGQPESRRLLYLTEAGNAMMDELGVMFLLPSRNEITLRRALEKYQAIRQILEAEFKN